MAGVLFSFVTGIEAKYKEFSQLVEILYSFIRSYQRSSPLWSSDHTIDIKEMLTCMFISLYAELLGTMGQKRKPPLKEEAVPTIFSYVLEKKKVCQGSIDTASCQSKWEENNSMRCHA